MEGMAQGKPFIVTDIRGNRDIIKNDQNGFIIPINNYQKTAEKIEELMTNREKKSEITEKNFIDVNKFSIEKIIKNMEKIYE